MAQTDAPIKIILVEHRHETQTTIHETIAQLPQFEIITEAFDRETAVSQANNTTPDIWIISLSLPDNECIATVRQIKTIDRHAKILLLTPTDPPHDLLLRAMDAGALSYINENAVSEEFQLALQMTAAERPYLPPESTHLILQKASNELEVSASERRDQMTQLLVVFIPIGAGITALLGYLEGEFWEQLGIHPQYLGINAAERLAVLITNLLLLIGIFGPLLFTTLWLTPFREGLNKKYGASAQKRPLLRLLLKIVNGRIGWLMFAGLILTITSLIARFAPLVSIMFIGTAVIAILLINTLGLEEYLPKELDLPRYNPWRVLIFFGTVIVIVAFVLGYELLIIGPDMRSDGVHNPTLAFFLDIEAFPVTVVDINGNEADYDALLLGGSPGVHVLHNPCNGNSFYVPAEQVFFLATEEVDCSKTGAR